MKPMQHLSQRKVARVLFDEGHNESWTIDEATARRMQSGHPADSSYAQAAKVLCERDFIVERNVNQSLINQTLSQTDVLVIAHPSDTKWEHTTAAGSPLFSADEMAAIQAFVHAGGGLVVLGETEQDKYGNNVNDLLRPFGICIENATLTDHAHCHNDVPSWVFAMPPVDVGLGVGVGRACFLRAGALRVQGEAKIVLWASSTASVPNAGLVAVAQVGLGRVVVFADSDLFGDDDLHQFDHQQLWLNACYWVAEAAFASTRTTISLVETRHRQSAAPASLQDWQQLKQATNALRKLQKADGALRRMPREMRRGGWCCRWREHYCIAAALSTPTNLFGLRVERIACLGDGGFAKPDFTKALALFGPS